MTRLYGRKCWILGIITVALCHVSDAQPGFHQGFGGGSQWGQRSRGRRRGSSFGSMRRSQVDFNNGPRFSTGGLPPQTRGGPIDRSFLSGQISGGPSFITGQQPSQRLALPQQPQPIPQFRTAAAPVAAPVAVAPVVRQPQPDIASLLSRIASAIPAARAPPVVKPPPSRPVPAVTRPASGMRLNPMAANPMAGFGAPPFGMGPMGGGMPFGPFGGMPGMIMSPMGPMTYDTYEDMILDPDMPDRRGMFGLPGMPPRRGFAPPLSVPRSSPVVLAPPIGGAAPVFQTAGMTPGLEPVKTASAGGVVALSPAAAFGGAPAIPAGVDQSTIRAALQAAIARVNQPQVG